MPEFVKKKIGEGLLLLNGSHPLGVGVTSTIVLTENQAVVFDSLCYPKETLELLEAIKAEKKSLGPLVNTHWHLDHVAGNQLFNTKIISHLECVNLMKTDLPQQIEDAKEIGLDIRPKYPIQTFDTKLSLEIEERNLVLIHLPGHTPDSIAGYLRTERVLIAGDTVMDLPFIGYGNSRQLIDSLRTIQGMKLNMIIQGHGNPCEKSKIAEDVQYLETARKIVREQLDESRSIDETLILPIESFLPSHRIEKLQDAYKEIVHKENLGKIREEFLHELSET